MKAASLALLETTYRRWPFRYHGVQARELLSGFLTGEELSRLESPTALITRASARVDELLHPESFASYLRTSEGLEVPCKVLDARLTWGNLQLKVLPWDDGNGSAWVSRDRCKVAHTQPTQAD